MASLFTYSKSSMCLQSRNTNSNTNGIKLIFTIFMIQLTDRRHSDENYDKFLNQIYNDARLC